MTNNSLDDLIKVDIDMSSPASSDESFDSILLVVPAPTGEGEAITGPFTISKAGDLKDYGYETTSAAYQAANAAFSQSPTPSKLMITVRAKTTGENPEYVSIADTLDAALKAAYFYGFHLTEFRSKNDIDAAATWAEANHKLFCFEYTDYANKPITASTWAYTVGMYSGDPDNDDGSSTIPEGNNYAALEMMAKCFGYTPGSETWHLKQLAGTSPSALTTAKKTALENGNINTFRRYAGKNVTFGGKVLAGEWIDVIRFRDWLKAQIQINVFNVLIANIKVPYEDSGIALIQGAVEKALKLGQTNGGIAQDARDEDGNLLAGYTISVPLVASIPEEVRASRKLSGINWTARLAGAIHLVEIKGNLTY